MSEIKIQRPWKGRISQQLSGFHMSSYVAPTNQVDHEVIIKPPPPPPPHCDPTEKKLWRKPLPNGCPAFDFQISEKTMVQQESLFFEKAEIPTRIQSRHYGNIPNLEAHLERACKNEKTVLLTKLLRRQ